VSKSDVAGFIREFSEAHGDKVEEVAVFDDIRVSITVKPEYFIDVAKTLRDDYGFIIPIGAGAVDYPDRNLMQMNYYLDSSDSDFMVVYRINVKRDAPTLPSMTQIWDGMSFHERETHEMFGIDFKDHPNLLPLLLPPDWKGGYPLRKDFKGEGITD